MNYVDYDDLPILDGLGVRHARGLLPPGLGTVSFIGPDEMRRAAASVSEGRSFGLSEPIGTFEAPLFGRAAAQHHVLEVGRNELEDVLDSFNPQSYSQLDGLAHVRAREHGFFGGATEISTAREQSGIHHWARNGIVGRGVLLDVHAARLARGDDDPAAGSPITVEELLDVADRQGTELAAGDILLVRTGWLESYRAHPDAPVTAWNGLHAGEATARFLWNRRIALVGADNPAVEDAPGSREAGSLHRRLLPALGLSLLELLRLDELAVACKSAGRWQFLLTIAPLPIRGAVSSPANAIAVL